ncbi:hypothetical protein CCR97_11335 [Rhodoplanes elegans]|uniref:Uncharacterized protein n=1 Tax=Rhodoplanes elegans TaxID=29408 RepID=A0A327K4W5_9BRAD|nr:hypothetical protein [Rhodoplanes elegans]MBK5958798.1 hypothetical protein [Rhodoplanes elegans]RAI32392.1 hypothetical protein CH338_24270 [Rhodoplanes elegans]
MSRVVMPTASFATLAFELRVYAHREVLANHGVEEFLARYPHPGLGVTLAQLRESAALVGQASMLLSLLAPHEAAVRAMVEAGTRPDAAPAPVREVAAP